MADYHPNGDPGSSRTRRRAVRLTEEGVALLARAIAEQWEKGGCHERLTWKARAEMLGLSHGTTDRILSRQGVDRSSLLIAFKNVGLDWDDAFCESARAGEPAQGPGEEVLPAAVESIPALTSHETSRRRVWPVWAVAALLLVAVLYLPASSAVEKWRFGQRRAAALQEFQAESVAAQREYDAARFEPAKAHAERARRLAMEWQFAYDLATITCIDGYIAAGQGKLREAKQLFTRAMNLRQSIDQDTSLILEALADVETRLGEFDEAERHLQQSLAGARKGGNRTAATMALRNLGSLEFQRGRLAEASRYFDEALATFPGDPANKDMETDIAARKALVLGRQGRHDEARSALERCLRYWQAKAHPRWIARTSFQIATVDRAAGRIEEARRRLDDARTAFRNVGDTAGVAECEEELRALDRRAMGTTADWPSLASDSRSSDTGTLPR